MPRVEKAWSYCEKISTPASDSRSRPSTSNRRQTASLLKPLAGYSGPLQWRNTSEAFSPADEPAPRLKTRRRHAAVRSGGCHVSFAKALVRCARSAGERRTAERAARSATSSYRTCAVASPLAHWPVNPRRYNSVTLAQSVKARRSNQKSWEMLLTDL